MELGAIGAIAEGRAAIALCRGGAAKTYSHTDPNEDATCFASGEGGMLAAVADGHHGFAAAERALQYLLETLAENWTADTAPFASDPEWTEAAYAAIAGANQAILEEASERRLPPAHTTLSLCLVRPRENRLVHASMGDSLIFQAIEGEIRELGWNALDHGRSHYLGYESMAEGAPRKKCLAGCEPLANTAALVLATDGLSENRRLLVGL